MYYGKQKREKKEEEPLVDKSLDYKPDDDETDTQVPIDINQLDL